MGKKMICLHSEKRHQQKNNLNWINYFKTNMKLLLGDENKMKLPCRQECDCEWLLETITSFCVNTHLPWIWTGITTYISIFQQVTNQTKENNNTTKMNVLAEKHVWSVSWQRKIRKLIHVSDWQMRIKGVPPDYLGVSCSNLVITTKTADTSGRSLGLGWMHWATTALIGACNSAGRGRSCCCTCADINCINV